MGGACTGAGAAGAAEGAAGAEAGGAIVSLSDGATTAKGDVPNSDDLAGALSCAGGGGACLAASGL